jgi:ParB family chromosome partitioning protein
MATDIIVRVDPKTLLVGPNVRKDVVLGKEFVASIKQHGVRVPISAQETEGGYEVVDGQRRTLAAVDADLDQVPVVVIEREEAAARIVDQLVVNEHRAGITDADQVAAIKELSLFDMPAQTIARKVGLEKKVVETAIAVGSSERAVAAMRGDAPVSFESAAILAEFEGDEEAQADLAARAAQGYHIGHYAQEWRDKRALAKLRADIEAMDGVRLIETPSHNQLDPLPVRELFVDEKRTQSLADLTRARLVKLSGDGLCAYPSLQWVGSERKPVIAYAVKGWHERGLFTYAYRTSGTSKPTTPEEAEALKAERRAARETTKSWVSATAVRMQFLQELVARRNPPKGWERYVGARLLTHEPFPNTGWKMALVILQLSDGRDSFSQRGVVEKHFGESPAKSAQIMLAAALGAIEGGYEFDRKGWQQERTPAYLLQLQEWGYEPSELEQSLVTKPRSRKATA